MTRSDDIDARKELLIAQAEFDRLKFAMAMHDLRRTVRPRADDGTLATAAHSPAARLLRFIVPVAGTSGAGRIVRAMSIALSVYRFLQRFGRR
ncbi:MAG TPA: hypothetical protein VNE58_15870 [Casimicrobiaceae bacterium]|nr:hypothetical protein [Casimicrobiaceae bacterium]